MNNLLLVEQSKSVAILTLNRPQAQNAFNAALLTALHDRLQSIADDRNIRAVLVQGAGANFSVGGDIRDFEKMTQLPAEERDSAFAALLDTAQAISGLIRALPQPVVAAVQGAAAGFGFSLALAADFTVASAGSSFVAGYSSLGVCPDGGMSLFLSQAVGYKKAAEILMLGGRLTAEEAQALALVYKVVPAEQLQDSARELAERLALGSPDAIRRSKQLLNLAGQDTLKMHLFAERQHFLQCVDGPNFSEGIAAFRAKRPPLFTAEGERQLTAWPAYFSSSDDKQ